MTSVNLYFHVHQPHRLKRYGIFDIGNDGNYFNAPDAHGESNKRIFDKVAQKCYIPTNKILLDLLEEHPGFRFSFSITGTVLEQMNDDNNEFATAVKQSFVDLFNTGRVDIVAETYHHSLASLYSKAEFFSQVKRHSQAIKENFNVEPNVFRNTELIYSNEIAKLASELGFKGILAEGVDSILDWRSPNYVYKAKDADIALLLKNYRLSDDIAFRFSNQEWSEWPLTAEKFGSWIANVNGGGQVVNLFMDFETFGEHQWEDTGIFDFLRALPSEVYKHSDNDFVTVSEALERYPGMDEVDMPELTSWADLERDVSAWLGNDMQKNALARLYALQTDVLAYGDDELVADWRKLQTSDHFYYMCTKHWSDGDVHKYFNPYESPYEAFITFMNVLHDFQIRLDEAKQDSEGDYFSIYTLEDLGISEEDIITVTESLIEEVLEDNLEEALQEALGNKQTEAYVACEVDHNFLCHCDCECDFRFYLGIVDKQSVVDTDTADTELNTQEIEIVIDTVDAMLDRIGSGIIGYDLVDSTFDDETELNDCDADFDLAQNIAEALPVSELGEAYNYTEFVVIEPTLNQTSNSQEKTEPSVDTQENQPAQTKTKTAEIKNQPVKINLQDERLASEVTTSNEEIEEHYNVARVELTVLTPKQLEQDEELSSTKLAAKIKDSIETSTKKPQMSQKRYIHNVFPSRESIKARAQESQRPQIEINKEDKFIESLKKVSAAPETETKETSTSKRGWTLSEILDGLNKKANIKSDDDSSDKARTQIEKNEAKKIEVAKVTSTHGQVFVPPAENFFATLEAAWDEANSSPQDDLQNTLDTHTEPNDF